MSEDKKLPKPRTGQEWLMEREGAGSLTRVYIAEMHPHAAGVKEWNDGWPYSAIKQVEYVALDRVRFVQRVDNR